MSATNFKTENNTYRKLIGNGLTYSIPRFQRDYSWTDVEWEDLWTDILGTIQEGGEPAHYMGYLVLQSQDEKSFDVIDGQQRLTTLTLIVLAALKNLNRLIEEKINLSVISNGWTRYAKPILATLIQLPWYRAQNLHLIVITTAIFRLIWFRWVIYRKGGSGLLNTVCAKHSSGSRSVCVNMPETV